LGKLLREPLDLLLVIGGYNYSNTSHLAEMGEAKLPTYFIKNAGKMQSEQSIVHYNLHLQKEVETQGWLPGGKATVGITAGASCPNNLIEETIRRLFQLRGISVQHFLATWGLAGTPASDRTFPPTGFERWTGRKQDRGLSQAAARGRVRDHTNPPILPQFKEWLRESPDANIISVSQNDCQGACECTNCHALDEAEGSHSG
jgi:LytB protein/Domain of unknown function (DUF4838)